MTTNILIMAHGYLYMDQHNNTMPFRSPNTTVISVAPPARTSWSNLQVEYALLMALHKNLKTADRNSFSKIVKQSSQESGVKEVLGRHPTHIPKSFGMQHGEIANKLLVFEDDTSPTPDPYYGIWWLDDEESPMNLLAMPDTIHFPKLGGKEMCYFSDVVEVLRSVFPDTQINILDYSCSSCLYPSADMVPNSDERLVRRLARGMVFEESPQKRKRGTRKGKHSFSTSRSRSRSRSRSKSPKP